MAVPYWEVGVLVVTCGGRPDGRVGQRQLAAVLARPAQVPGRRGRGQLHHPVGPQPPEQLYGQVSQQSGYVAGRSAKSKRASRTNWLADGLISVRKNT